MSTQNAVLCDVTPCTFVHAYQGTVRSCWLMLIPLPHQYRGNRFNRCVGTRRHMPDDRMRKTERSDSPSNLFVKLNSATFSEALRRYVSAAVIRFRRLLLTDKLHKLLVSEHKAPEKSKVCAMLCVCRLQAEGALASADPSRSTQTGLPKRVDKSKFRMHTNTQITMSHWQLLLRSLSDGSIIHSMFT